jgi:hypothetical protein
MDKVTLIGFEKSQNTEEYKRLIEATGEHESHQILEGNYETPPDLLREKRLLEVSESMAEIKFEEANKIEHYGQK